MEVVMSIKLADIEINDPLPDIGDLGRYSALWVLVREKGIPLGYVRLKKIGEEITRDQLKVAIAEQFPRESQPQDLHPVAESGRDPSHAYISVIVCTRFRPESLKRTLDALLRLDYPKYEIIVVDNCPPNGMTGELLKNYPMVHYLIEPRAGTNRARNMGIEKAEGEIIAFIDDDAVPDPRWLRGIAAGFSDSNVGCVTGLILPAELETPAQELFEMGYGGFSIGFKRKTLRIDTWKYAQFLPDIGQGCNMALRKDLVRRLGMFNVVLDGGTPTLGGGEIDMFHLILRAGYRIEYRPDALMFHTHRRDLKELRRQVCGYSQAYMSLITKWFFTEPDDRLVLLSFLGVWYKAWFLRRIKRKLFRQEKTPSSFIALEALHALAGPLAYFRSLRNTRNLDKHTAPDSGLPVAIVSRRNERE
jgi:glycosyltransferase involved in cell wall biosynthesis